MYTEAKTSEYKRAITPDLLHQIEELAISIRHGSISLVFQDGYLIQIEKNEKIRISPNKN